MTTIAILPFTNASGVQELDWMRTGLSDMLVTDISQSQYVRPVPGGRMIQVLGELGLTEQTRFDDAALESVSNRAPAEACGKITICHVPPGNPDNAKTLSVGVDAWSGHQGHGDTCGPCN